MHEYRFFDLPVRRGANAELFLKRPAKKRRTPEAATRRHFGYRPPRFLLYFPGRFLQPEPLEYIPSAFSPLYLIIVWTRPPLKNK